MKRAAKELCIEITDVCVSGWEAAIRGMRMPMKSMDLSDSWVMGSEVRLGERDLKLAKSLAFSGPEQGKFLRMINVTATIKAPAYFWQQLDTYKVGTTRNSSSLMHKTEQLKYTEEFFAKKDVQSALRMICNNMDKYNRSIGILNDLADLESQLAQAYKETRNVTYLRAIRQIMPMGYLYTAVWQGNYAVLRNIYWQRRRHRLEEWTDFCEWIKKLPYSELIVGERKTPIKSEVTLSDPS